VWVNEFFENLAIERRVFFVFYVESIERSLEENSSLGFSFF